MEDSVAITVLTLGRDPLASYSQGKLDVAAVASTLKAYFRELSIPLFPTNKYQEFINCTRHEDHQSRLDALAATIHSLPPQVVSVMRFLFRFLFRVSLHSIENKMGSANLALVFGPTLTRAPDSLDPRQLHNDVPSVNVLIQLCIEGHEYIFGDAGDTPTASPTQDVREQTLSTSPPTEPPSAPPAAPVSRDSPHQVCVDVALCYQIAISCENTLTWFCEQNRPSEMTMIWCGCHLSLCT